MKQNITAIIIFTLIILGSFFSLNYTESVSKNLLKSIELCETDVTRYNWDSALEHVNVTQALWNKHKPRLAIILAHRQLDEISDLIVTITSLVNLNDKNKFITENKRLTALVKNLSTTDALTFENLF